MSGCSATVRRSFYAPKAFRWAARPQELDSFATKREGGGPRARQNKALAADALAIWEARMDISIEELRSDLAEGGLVASTDGRYRFFELRGMTRQKGSC